MSWFRQYLVWILVGIVAIWLIMRFPSWRLGFGRGGGALKILGTLAGIVLIIAIMLWSQYGLDYSATALTPPSDIMPFLNKNFAWLGWLAGHPGALAWVGVTVVATFLAFGCFPGGTAAVTILGFCLVLGYLMFLQPAYQQTATNVAPQVTAPMTTTEPPAAPQPKQAAPAGKFDGTYCGGGDIAKGIRQYCFQIKGNVGIAIESNGNYRVGQPMLWIDEVRSNGFCGRQYDSGGNVFPLCGSNPNGYGIALRDQRPNGFGEWVMGRTQQ